MILSAGQPLAVDSTRIETSVENERIFIAEPLVLLADLTDPNFSGVGLRRKARQNKSYCEPAVAKPRGTLR